MTHEILKIKSLIKEEWDNDIYITVIFKKGKKEGRFSYTLIGQSIGIFDCVYDEDSNEDIYNDIHNWVNRYITIDPIIIRYKMKVIK